MNSCNAREIWENSELIAKDGQNVRDEIDVDKIRLENWGCCCGNSFHEL